MESIEGTASSTGPQLQPAPLESMVVHRVPARRGLHHAGPVGVDHSMALQPGPLGSIEGTASSPGPQLQPCPAPMESIEGTASSPGPQGIAAAGPVGVDHSMALQPGPLGSIEETASSTGPRGSLDGTPTKSPGIQGCASCWPMDPRLCIESRPAAPTSPGPQGID